MPFDKLAAAFEKQHPGVDVLTESHGSIQVLRHVTELGDRMDFVATADEQLIPPLLYDRDDPATGKPWASWYCTFATNRMVLAVSPKSPLAGELTSKTWYRRLTQKDVRFGLADPRFDAAGYRALMVLQLAEREYDDPYLFEDVLMGRFTTPITVARRGKTDVVEVPEILETSSGSNIVLRGASIQLVALLESGDLDCAFEYESVARQHGLKYVRLPASIDLGEQEYAQAYRTVEREAGLPPLRQRPARVHGGRDPLRVHDPGERPRPRAGAAVRRVPARAGRAADPRGRPPAAAHASPAGRRGGRAGGGEAGVRGHQMNSLRGHRHPADPGRPAAPASPVLMRGRRVSPFWALCAVAGVVLVTFVALPAASMIVGAGAGLLGEALRQDDVRRSLVLTVTAALITTVIGFIVGVPLAYLLARRDFPGKRAIEGIIDLPIVFPHTAAGIALLTVYGRQGVVGRLLAPLGITFTETVAGIVLAMLFVSLPFLVDGARESFALVDERYEHVARTLGLVPLRRLRARHVPAGLARRARRRRPHVGPRHQRVRRRRDPGLQPQGHLGAHVRALRGLRAARRAAAGGAHRDRRLRRVPAGADVPGAAAPLEDRGPSDRPARTLPPRPAASRRGRSTSRSGTAATSCCSARAAPARAWCSRPWPACARPRAGP